MGRILWKIHEDYGTLYIKQPTGDSWFGSKIPPATHRCGGRSFSKVAFNSCLKGQLVCRIEGEIARAGTGWGLSPSSLLTLPIPFSSVSQGTTIYSFYLTFGCPRKATQKGLKPVHDSGGVNKISFERIQIPMIWANQSLSLNAKRIKYHQRGRLLELSRYSFSEKRKAEKGSGKFSLVHI